MEKMTVTLDKTDEVCSGYYGWWEENWNEYYDDEVENEYYKNPDWCSYDSTYFGEDDAFSNYYGAGHWYYYYNANDDGGIFESTAETMKISNAEGKTFVVTVTNHPGNEELYYRRFYYGEKYYDHNLVPHLTINDGAIGPKDGFYREVDYYTSDLKKEKGEWVKNPAYDHEYQVKITCNKKCACTAEYST